MILRTTIALLEQKRRLFVISTINSRYYSGNWSENFSLSNKSRRLLQISSWMHECSVIWSDTNKSSKYLSKNWKSNIRSVR